MQVVTLRYRCWKWINQIARIYRVLFFFFPNLRFKFSSITDIYFFFTFFFFFLKFHYREWNIRRKFKKGINNTNRTFSSIVYFNRYIYIYILVFAVRNRFRFFDVIYLGWSVFVILELRSLLWNGSSFYLDINDAHIAAYLRKFTLTSRYETLSK